MTIKFPTTITEKSARIHIDDALQQLCDASSIDQNCGREISCDICAYGSRMNFLKAIKVIQDA